MPRQSLFAGLIVDESDRPVEVVFVGGEPMYVVNDAGFRRHIPTDQVDRQVLDMMRQQITGNEETLTEQTAKMLGQEDIFSRAMILNQLKHLDDQFDALLNSGIPEEGRALTSAGAPRSTCHQAFRSSFVEVTERWRPIATNNRSGSCLCVRLYRRGRGKASPRASARLPGSAEARCMAIF